MYTQEFLQSVYDTYEKIPYKSELYTYIIRSTPYLTGKVFPKQRLWHILNNTTNIPVCKTCGKVVKWDDAKPFINQKYREFCSVVCSRKDTEVSEKKKRTELDRYGKGKKSIVDKIKKTNIEKYGTEFAIQKEEFKQKRVNTTLEKYGVENVIQVPEIVESRKQTNILRFGVEAPAQSVVIKNKMKNTLLQEYGVPHYGILKLSEDAKSKLTEKHWLIEQHIHQKKKMIEIAQELDVHQATVLRYLNHHNIPIQHYANSLLEQDIAQWISEHITPNIVRNTKQLIGPKEIDIFLIDFNIAIEVNGIYWHSELQGKDKNYHLNKLKACKEKGIRLIQIWENEWNTKRHIVESKLKSLTGNTTKIFARKCEIIKITNKEAMNFLQANHMQGHCSASINIALVFDNKIVTVATYSRPRFSKNYDYELTRFCSKAGYTIIGGASKLHKYFTREYDPTSIVSFCDLRYGTGNMYKQLGYKHSHTSAPNYFYFKQNNINELWSRVKFQKHKLPKVLEYFDVNLTEWDNMVKNDYNRIWDCGNSVWVWRSS